LFNPSVSNSDTGHLFPIAILAGGLATRLWPLTKNKPKSLLAIHGQPFIFYQLQLLKKAGFEKVILCVGYLGELIRRYVKDGRQFGLSVSYSCDETPLLGTAGALKKALPLLGNCFFVLYGDSYLIVNYREIQRVFLQKNKCALMTVFKNNNQGDKSNIEFSGNQIIAYNKRLATCRMQHIDYGLGLFNKAAFNKIPTQTYFDLADLYQILLQEGRLASFEVFQPFYEVGSRQGLLDLRYYLFGKECVV
jgi:N-acetyl-alpha-D-muramate 1-phosphate uridylyltransferase